MKTPEEIKNALRMCSTWEKNCEECPYKPMKKAISCSAEMKRDSLTYIEQLEERIDLMMIQMHGDCGCCKHRNAKEEPCRSCLNEEDSPYWQYEGLPVIKL